MIGQGNGFTESCSAARLPFGKFFSGGKTVELMTLGRVAEWFRNQGEGRLRLPPIQRSFVWRNEQIINYWDSLMRGYPAGMMMVTQVATNRSRHYGRGLDNKTEELADTDFQLFDGQQRLTAILLGLSAGSLTGSLRLWVDIGSLKSSGDRLFELRVNSTGQPFGYKSDAPNEKVRAEDRHDVHKNWPLGKDEKPKPPHELFKDFSTKEVGPLISARCAVPLNDILTSLTASGKEETESKLRMIAGKASIDIKIDIDDFLTRLENAINAEIIVKLIDNAVLDESNYPRFFGRVGQGGTRLSDEELIYSLIKDRYPQVHDRLEEIVQGLGRFASEVDLVLGALRIAQTMAPWPEAKEWERAGRPTPDRVRSLLEKGAETTERYFRSMLPDADTTSFRLRTVIRHLRDGLLYNATSNPSGLPFMLLARLPRDLLDVLLLFAFKRGEDSPWNKEDRSTLIAFALFWLLFVAYDDKAAYCTFVEAEAEDWCFGQRSVAALIRHLETKEISRYAPRADNWQSLIDEVQQRGCTLAVWAERFSSEDIPGRPSPGEALRVLSTHNECQKRALIWIQRRYVAGTFPSYDPTSTRDDDLPFDLDHAIPKALFGFHGNAQRQFKLSDTDFGRFMQQRGAVGNSLGNLRWLAAADNRARGMEPLEDERSSDGNKLPVDDYIRRCFWNKLIEEVAATKTWTNDNVATFQWLIDSRTLKLIETLMVTSGITSLINIADSGDTSLPPVIRA